MYSGTVGACLEALIFKKPTFAISTEDNFALVEQHFSRVWDFINNRNLLSGEYLLNINFPLGDEVKGIALGKLHYRRDKNYFIKKEDGYYAFRYMEDIADAPQNTDLYQVNHDIISIVPLNNSYFSTELFDKLNNK
jgi:broad specificity polyphosphatase/5'/3'-nucleotidase SurE